MMTGKNIIESQKNHSKTKRVHIETWGCQMNVADSEAILSMMQSKEYKHTDDPNSADLIVLNTCHIREKARHKVLSRLGKLKEIKTSNSNLKIAVAGCVAQAEGKKLLNQAPMIDVLLGPGKISELPSLLAEQEKTGKQTMAIGFKKGKAETEAISDGLSCQDSSDEVSPSISGKFEVTRFVNIQQGCDNFCTFCVVPFTRGREISVTAEIVYAKAKALVKHGAKEIMLLGQNVNSYGLDLVRNKTLIPSESGPFVDLLDKVSSIPDLKRLRFTTSNPHDLTFDLANIFSRQPKLGRYFHLPVQSGSDRILAAMKRKVTVEEYMEKISWLRHAVSDMAISTDLIVGFPGETEEDFQGTLDLIKKVRFSFVFAFKYSSRKGTAAARFREHVPEDIMSERLARLNKLQDQITLEQQKAEIGQVREVLFAYESLKEKGVYYGKSEHFKLVRLRCNRNIVGEIHKVRITDFSKTSLTSELLEI